MASPSSSPCSPPFEQAVCFFYTADLATTEQFYGEVLGLPLALDQGVCKIFQISSDGFIGFCTHREPGPTDGVIITLATSQVEQVYERLLTQGVAFEKPLAYHEVFRITNAFFRDPNGYLVEIQRSDDPAWMARSSP